MTCLIYTDWCAFFSSIVPASLLHKLGVLKHYPLIQSPPWALPHLSPACKDTYGLALGDIFAPLGEGEWEVQNAAQFSWLKVLLDLLPGHGQG